MQNHSKIIVVLLLMILNFSLTFACSLI